MATVINNPPDRDGGGGAGVVIGVIIAIVILILFFVYGLPAFRGGNDADIEVDVPENINVNPGGGQQ